MPSRTEAIEISQDGKETAKRRFDARDWDYIAEYVSDTYHTRKGKRRDLENHWKDVDRQIAMEPDIAFKKLPNGKIDTNKVWMSEMEMPLQAQALEVLTADARRLMFPDSGSWFCAHAEMTDKYLARVDFQSLVLGDENEVPSRINQDNADKLVEGYLLDMFDQYDFVTRYDRINAEAFKYGMGVARGRMETRNIYIHEARGVRSEKRRIPVLAPCSIKNTYLDDPLPSMHSAQVFGDAHIVSDNIRYANLVVASNKGSIDPNDEDGGWMPKNVARLKPNDDGYVEILEMEGDIVIPRKTTRSVVLPACIVTVALGAEAGRQVIRFRWRKQPFSSFLLHPYHYEHVDNPYPTSPLMKGRPVQIMVTDALNRLMDSAALKNSPPVGWDRSDQHFAAQGGPVIHPSALWASTDPQAIKAHTEVGGDPNALLAVFTQGVQLYSELTGILPARLGAQTVSHTTAYAKGAELQRGAVRTVDYIQQCGKGPVSRWLDMAYRMGRDELKKNQDISFYIDAYGGYVSVDKDALPDNVSFTWYGAGGPQEEALKTQQRLNAAQLALKVDQIAISLGQRPTVDLKAMVQQILREGGWSDLDAITSTDAAVTAPAQGLTPALAAVQTLVPRSGQVAVA